MRHAVYAGSFDPITNGHLWMIENGSHLFETLTVAIGVNPDKKYLFTLAERMEMITAAAAPFANVKVASFENLFLVNYARQIGASFILRGIRNEQDYGYERGMRYVNAELNSDILTVFLMPPREYAEISSSFVKGLVGPDGWQEITRAYVPAAVHGKLLAQFGSEQ
jgi:pantetheine-phosphate adenylyltransferase